MMDNYPLTGLLLLPFYLINGIIVFLGFVALIGSITIYIKLRNYDRKNTE